MPLHADLADLVADARRRARRGGVPETHGKVIAELMFGFWRFVLDARHSPTLWAPALRHAFPHLRPKVRTDVYEPCRAPERPAQPGRAPRADPSGAARSHAGRTCSPSQGGSVPRQRRGSGRARRCLLCSLPSRRWPVDRYPGRAGGQADLFGRRDGVPLRPSVVAPVTTLPVAELGDDPRQLLALVALDHT